MATKNEQKTQSAPETEDSGLETAPAPETAEDNGPDLSKCANCGERAVVVTPEDAGHEQQAFCAAHTPITWKHLLEEAK